MRAALSEMLLLLLVIAFALAGVAIITWLWPALLASG